jgi:hypothetical protein
MSKELNMILWFTAIPLVLLLSVVTWYAYHARKRYLELLQEDFFNFDMDKFTKAITVKRGERTIELTFIQLLNALGDDKSLEHETDDLNKEAGLSEEDKLTPIEMHALKIRYGPALMAFYTNVKGH